MTEVKLFIGNLPHDTSDAELLATFAPFDNLLSVCLLGSGKSRSGNACAFAVYSSIDSANYAIKSLDGCRQLRPGSASPPIQVRFARNGAMADQVHNPPAAAFPISLPVPTSSSFTRKRSYGDSIAGYSTEASTPVGADGYVKFFVGCLPVSTTRAQLEEMFRSRNFPVRPEEGVHLMPGRGASGQACAFVHVHEKSAADVIETLNGKIEVDGCVINVRLANSQERKKVRQSVDLHQMPAHYSVFGGYGEFEKCGKFSSMFFHPYYVAGSSYGRPLPPDLATGGYHVISKTN